MNAKATEAPSQELPESWQPAPPPSVPPLSVPERETNDYQELAAWYSGFSFCEHYRKVVQAQCEELVRARFVAKKESITEKRIDALARLEPSYLNFLERHLHGRILWEKSFLAQGGLR